MNFIKKNKIMVIILAVILIALIGLTAYTKLSGGDSILTPKTEIKRYIVSNIDEYFDFLQNDTLLYPQTNENFRYNVYKQHIEISEYIGQDTTVTVPAEIDGYPVLTICSEAFANTSVQNVTVEEGVAGIDINAFANAAELTTVTLNEGLLFIDDGAFYGCNALSSINIPSTLIYIGINSFYGCASLPSIEFGYKEEITDKKGNVSIVEHSALTTIEQSAFAGCTSLDEFIAPQSLTTIGISAFEGCTSLTEVELFGNVMLIPEKAFADCTSLLSVTIHEHEKTDEEIETETVIARQIDASAFANCTSLMSIWLSADVSAISDEAFTNVSEGFSISGYSSSQAAVFAAVHKIDFVLLDYEMFQESKETAEKIAEKVSSITEKYEKEIEIKDDYSKYIIKAILFADKDTFISELQSYLDELVANKTISGYTIKDNGVAITLVSGQVYTYKYQIYVEDTVAVPVTEPVSEEAQNG